MHTIPSYQDLAEIARTSPCSYALINTVAVFQPRNRLLELDYAHDLLQTSGHDFSRAEIEDCFNKMAKKGLGIVHVTQTEDVIFSWSALPLIMQEGLRLGCLPSEFVSPPAPFDEKKINGFFPIMHRKGAPIVAVLNDGRTIKLEVPHRMNQGELDQVMSLLTSLRKSPSVKSYRSILNEPEFDDTSLEDDSDDSDLDTGIEMPIINNEEFDDDDDSDESDEFNLNDDTDD